METTNIEVQSEKGCLPVRKHPDDAAFDLVTSERFTILANQTLTVNTGTKLSIPRGYAGLVLSRSGLAASGITVVNSPGLIDAGYLGEIKVLLHNARRVRTFEAGTRIAQIMFIKLPSVNLQVVQELTATTLRGENGLGSTGIN